RALKLNPTHVSAEFGLARAWQRKGDAEKSRQHLERFQHLVQERISAPLSPAYGEQGALSFAEEMRVPESAMPSPIPVKFVQDQTYLTKMLVVYQGMAVSRGDFDNDGRVDWVIGESKGIRLLHQDADGSLRDVTKSSGIDEPTFVSSL